VFGLPFAYFAHLVVRSSWIVHSSEQESKIPHFGDAKHTFISYTGNHSALHKLRTGGTQIMSITANGQDIACDVFGCKNTARLAAGLRPSANRAAPVEGWLFLCQDGVWRHFCPDCARAYLDGNNALISEEDFPLPASLETNRYGVGIAVETKP
jgi:hypothetical protein